MLTKELATAPNNLEAFWMPFTANRDFKAAPRLLAGAEGIHYTLVGGKRNICLARHARALLDRPEEILE